MSRLERRVRELTGIDDVEEIDILPDVVRYDRTLLHPRAVVRIRDRYFVEVVEHPGEWWMGEMQPSGELSVWGVYGTLAEAVVADLPGQE